MFCFCGPMRRFAGYSATRSGTQLIAAPLFLPGGPSTEILTSPCFAFTYYGDSIASSDYHPNRLAEQRSSSLVSLGDTIGLADACFAGDVRAARLAQLFAKCRYDADSFRFGLTHAFGCGLEAIFPSTA